MVMQLVLLGKADGLLPAISEQLLLCLTPNLVLERRGLFHLQVLLLVVRQAQQ